MALNDGCKHIKSMINKWFKLFQNTIIHNIKNYKMFGYL